MAKSASGGRFSPLFVGGVLLLALAAALIVAYGVIGSHVDAAGWLHEPFACIPLAWLSGLAGAVLVAVSVWRGRFGRAQRKGTEDLSPPTVR